MSLSINSKIGDLLDNDQSRAILEKHLPGIAGHPQIGMAKGFPLAMVAPMSGGLISNDALAAIKADLEALG